MTSKLTGTVALVTGASSGIGEATARRFAEDGASVALVARRRDRLETLATEIEQADGTALVVEADITDRTQAEAAVQHTVERFGRLDILLNNAGLMLLGPVVGVVAPRMPGTGRWPVPGIHTCSAARATQDARFVPMCG